MTTSVITFIAPHDNLLLTPEKVDALAHSLAEHGARIIEKKWLAPNEACDVFFDGISPTHAQDIAHNVLHGEVIDAVAQSAEGRKKKLLIADMDSTMITVECIDELADFAGLKEKVSAITERAMNGELDFQEALYERVALLEGLDESVLQTTYDTRVKYMAGAKELLATMRGADALCVLVSGGFTFFTERVTATLGFHFHKSNRLDVRDGKLTGRVIPPILDKEAKLTNLRIYATEKGLESSEILAVGDGANDLPMLQAAGAGVAYHAKPHVRAQAAMRIDHADLRALLYIQGYTQQEFKSGI